MLPAHAENLFRREAIAALRKSTMGRPISLLPRPWFWLSCLLLMLLACTVIFVFSTDVARKATARGWLISEPGAVRMTHGAAALVYDVAVSAGDFVEVGDPVFYLSQDLQLSSGQSAAESRLASVRQDLSEIAEQLQLTRDREKLERGALQQQSLAHANESTGIESELSAMQRQVALGNEALARVRTAAGSGAISEMALNREEQSQAELRQRLAVLRQRSSAHRREQDRLSALQDDLAIKFKLERSTLRQERSRLMQHIDELEAQRLTVFRSPISGVVATVDVQRGNNVKSQQLLATILPQGLQLAAELFVSSRAIGQLRAGQSVRLAFDAFPKQRFGTYVGTVDYVSDYVVLPGDLAGAIPINEASYKVRVTIDDDTINSPAGEFRLRPGMTLAADLVLEERSILSWLLEPLQYFGRNI